VTCLIDARHIAFYYLLTFLYLFTTLQKYNLVAYIATINSQQLKKNSQSLTYKVASFHLKNIAYFEYTTQRKFDKLGAKMLMGCLNMVKTLMLNSILA